MRSSEEEVKTLQVAELLYVQLQEGELDEVFRHKPPAGSLPDIKKTMVRGEKSSIKWFHQLTQSIS